MFGCFISFHFATAVVAVVFSQLNASTLSSSRSLIAIRLQILLTGTCRRCGRTSAVVRIRRQLMWQVASRRCVNVGLQDVGLDLSIRQRPCTTTWVDYESTTTVNRRLSSPYRDDTRHCIRGRLHAPYFIASNISRCMETVASMTFLSVLYTECTDVCQCHKIRLYGTRCSN